MKYVYNFLYWKMAIFKAILYTAIVYGTTFLSQTETYTGEQWTALSLFETIRIHIFCAIAAGGTLKAFLDETMTKLSPEADTPPPPKIP